MLVPEVGVEPTRPFRQRILSPSRLPFRHSGPSEDFVCLVYLVYLAYLAYCEETSYRPITSSTLYGLCSFESNQRN